MISQTMLDEMNDQIMHEMYSAYLYLSMSSYCESVSMAGFASWMRFQAKEEMEHAMKFYDFIQDRGGRVVLQAIAQPPAEFGTMREIFEQTLQHEQKVTGRIHHLYKLALQENDYASQVFLNWFVDEQVEEEKNASQILDILKLIGDSPNGLFHLDHRLSKRSEE